jgi:hypothetical protein
MWITTHDDDEIVEVYYKIVKVLSMTRVGENVIILGNWCVSRTERWIYYMVYIYIPYCRKLWTRKINERGEKLIQFKLVLANKPI